MLYIDVCGPAGTENLGSERYFVGFIDDSTRYTQLCFILSQRMKYLVY